MSQGLAAARKALIILGSSTAALGVGTGFYRYANLKKLEEELPTNLLEPWTNYNTEKNPQSKRILIIGGGVVGVTTAYKLARKGHSVTILESRNKPGEECSACAAGGMQRSNPTVDRDSWIAVFKCVSPTFGGETGGNKNDFKFFHMSWFDTLSDPFFWRWVYTFTRTSLFPDEHQSAKQEEMLKFTSFAVNDMVRMMERRSGYRFDKMGRISGYNNLGSLSVSYEPIVKSDTNKSPGKNPTQSKMSYEPHRKVTGTEQVLDLEPSLKWQETLPTSAKFEFEAKSASSERFTKEMARRCTEKHNVKILYDTAVRAITVTPNNGDEKPRISAVRTNRGVLHVPKGTHVVVAAGAWTPTIFSLMDLYVPVYPLKGYAMSVSAMEARKQLKLSEKDLPSRIVADKFMFTTRLGDEIRITSIGEFSGWSTTPQIAVNEGFRLEAKRQFPQLSPLIDKATTRCGHRPLVSDGILLLGAVDSHENLYVSVGPGSNGWKLAMGSGEVIERLVSGQSPKQIKEDLDFDSNALSPSGRVLYSPMFSRMCRARWNV